jgi:hypothetical protein
MVDGGTGRPSSPKAQPFVCSVVKRDDDVHTYYSTVLCSLHTMYHTQYTHTCMKVDKQEVY